VRETTFSATDNSKIVVWQRAKPIRTLSWGSTDAAAVVSLLSMQSVLLSLHEDGGIRVWDVAAAATSDGEALLFSHSFSISDAGNPTAFVHPDTYINKVAIGTDTGNVVIFNFRSGTTVYKSLVMAGTAVTCLAQSPAADVIAVGGADGRIILQNLRSDERIAVFMHDATLPGSCAVSALSFSFGNSLSIPLLASATESGALVLWNLQERQVAASMPSAHDGAVTLVSFLPGEPCLLTASSSDNAVRVWTIDRLDSTLKLLRSRAGHTAPPRCIRYYAGAAVASIASGANAQGCEIASAGSDRTLRLFHTALDRQNTELSQGHVLSKAKELGVHPTLLRLPPIISLATSDRRYGQWADVVSAHAGSSRVSCWSWEKKRLEERMLVMPDSSESALCVAISACGNFAFVGGAGGTLCAFNLQSGARRGVFPPNAAAKSSHGAKGAKHGHLHPEGADFLGPVDRDTGRGRYSGGLAVDGIDHTMLASAGIAPPKAIEQHYRAPINSGNNLMPLQGADLEGATVESAAGALHVSSVCGVASDALNSVVVSADDQGRVIWWDFSSHAALHVLRMTSGVHALTLQRESGLAALSCEDFSVRIVDVATRRLVRSFVGHSNRITDVAFSSDGRWLVSASLDRSLRVWDLPTSRCIDWMTFQSAPVSVALSPTGEYLVSAHSDMVGLCLWANRAFFGAVVLEAAVQSPVAMDFPSAEGVSDVAKGAAETGKRGRIDSGEGAAKSPEVPEVLEPKAGCSITLSGLPPTSWANLAQLDAIATRNRPVEPVKKPEAAPFFLPTTGGLHPVFAAPSTAVSDEAPSGSKKLVRANISAGARTVLAALLRDTIASDKAVREGAPKLRLENAYAAVSSHLSSLPPSSVDIELRSLCLTPDSVDGLQLLRALLHYFCAELAAGRRYDLVQAHMSLVLEVHQDALAALPNELRALRDTQSPGSARLVNMLDKGLCMVSTFLGQM
jgi:U3 small nucleolar RNA-associated protein 21